MNNIFHKGHVYGIIVLFVSLTLSTSGCAGRVTNSLPDSQILALSHNQRGITYFAQGDSLQALGEFSEALRISRSIEQNDGIVVALVNYSRVHRQGGDATAALAAISGALPHVSTQSPLYAEVAFEMAQAKLLSGNIGEASEWASQAVAAATGSAHGMMMNLEARILFLKGKMTEAESQTREALLLNRKNGVRDEEANSLRTLGDIQAVTERGAEAEVSYNQALEIDKASGKSRKIVADLRALARLAESQNGTARALEFYARAFAASSAGADFSGAENDLMNMSRIHENRGEKELAERLKSERGNSMKNIRIPQ